MDLVVDTSVLLAVVANEPEKAALVEQTTGTTLVAPASVPWEIGNAFSAMLKRQRISIIQAKEALAVYRRIPVRYLDVDLVAALSLAAELNIYAYDAYLIVCAQKQRCSLLSLDRGLLHAAKQAGVPVVEVNT